MTNTEAKIVNWDIKPIKETEGERFFSADEVIDAYFRGKKDQNTENVKVMMEKLEVNLKTAMGASEGLFQMINEMGHKCAKVFLKVKNITHFTSLFLIEESAYLSDEFVDVYKESIRRKKVLNNTATFDYSTIFTPSSESLDTESLQADGYILSYGGEVQQP